MLENYKGSMKKNNLQQDFSKYGLVIQVPLESIGRSGASAYKTLSDFYAWASDQFQAIPRPIIKLLRVTPFLRKCYFNSWKKTFCPSSYRTLDGLFWRGEKFTAEIPKSNGGFFLNRNPKKKEKLYPNLKYRTLSRWLLNRLKKVNYKKEAKSLNGI